MKKGRIILSKGPRPSLLKAYKCKDWLRDGPCGVTTYQFRMGPVASFRVLHMSLIESTLEVFVFICRIDMVIRKPS